MCEMSFIACVPIFVVLLNFLIVFHETSVVSSRRDEHCGVNDCNIVPAHLSSPNFSLKLSNVI